MNRKDALRLLAASLAMPTVASSMGTSENLNLFGGRIRQSVCRWCFQDIPLPELAAASKDIGLQSVELLGPDEWQVVLDAGLTCAIAYGNDHGLTRGFNDPSLHSSLMEQYAKNIPKAADAGLTQIICFPGNRRGMDDQTGLENCARGLDPVIKIAEKHNIVISMELMNSKINHPDYMADSTAWGVALVDKIGSPNFKLLYDIYHMQIQEGNVIATIRQYSDYISHYHTAGVPGRHEIDESQELNYPAIMNAIAETGYAGFVGQEFIPARPDKMASLAQAQKICDV
ncbi:hydroxypyruvate isomerase family protein [Fulvivirga sedimenti]|uniref:TIM barrel protein n=1 Tax=Fulvivirga sedimenti TaxID=2879465 RepID=A0A9X1HVI7_9BACT|nr:TIM barrel protein [Fulvivirga sedimenti]MCA6078720.1 TIM barrel protein [Fulvivirga sedimenti]